MVYPTKSEPWAGDALGRRADGEFLASFLVKKIAERRRLGLPRTFVLNIDAVCGQGKTYFLTNFQRTLQAVGHPVAYVNAWTDDYADDPLISVMVAIEASLKKHSKLKKTGSSLTEIGAQVVAAGAKGALKQAATKYLGEGATTHISDLIGSATSDLAKASGEEIGKALGEIYDAEGKALLEKFHRAQKSIAEFKQGLSKLIDKIGKDCKPPLFILIDELDRCKPTYAVTLLERVKHIFDVNDVVFVMATDTGQPYHSVMALYGADFDAPRYLLRFFDQTY